MKRLIIFILSGILYLTLASCFDNKEKAILNCADYDYVRYANLNPHLFINFDFTMIKEEAERREIKLKNESLEDKKKRKDFIDEVIKKDGRFKGREEFIDPISKDLVAAIKFSKSREFLAIENKNIHKLTKDYKKNELRYYSKFYQDCSERFYSYRKDSEKDLFLKTYENFQIVNSNDISKLKVRDKEKDTQIIKLLKNYSETESFIKQIILTEIKWSFE